MPAERAKPLYSPVCLTLAATAYPSGACGPQLATPLIRILATLKHASSSW